VLEIRNATKQYRKGTDTILALDGMSARFEPGELVIVHGPSGSGKSSLLLMLGGMMPPDSGQVLFGEQDIYGWSGSRRNRFRMNAVGFVFQRFFLVPYLTVRDNVRMSLALRGDGDKAGEKVDAWSERLGIRARLNHYPTELSVGEQQRAALARALVGDQKLILADEPTGNLDAKNVDIVAECLAEESRRGRLVVLATHNLALLEMGTRQFHIKEGRECRDG
jgi:putative ABC transport system ATP-binding protein